MSVLFKRKHNICIKEKVVLHDTVIVLLTRTRDASIPYPTSGPRSRRIPTTHVQRSTDNSYSLLDLLQAGPVALIVLTMLTADQYICWFVHLAD